MFLLADCLRQVCNVCASDWQQPTQRNCTSVGEVAVRRRWSVALHVARSLAWTRSSACPRRAAVVCVCVCGQQTQYATGKTHTHTCARPAGGHKQECADVGSGGSSGSVSALCSSAWHRRRLAAPRRGNTLLKRQCGGGGAVGVITH